MNVKQAKNFFCLGKVFVKKGEWEEAIAAYQKAIKLAPDWEEVKQYLADAENKLQQQEARGKLTIAEQFGKILATQGKSHLKKVAAGDTIKVDSNLAEDYHLQGDDLLEKGEKEEAIKVYRKALEIKPELWEVHHKLGNLLQEKEELEAAVAAYDKSIELKSDFCWSYNNLGDVLVKLEKWEEAVIAYRRAVELNPDFPWGYYKLGDVLVKLQDWEEAIAAYNSAIELNPNIPSIYEKLGYALQEQVLLYSKEIGKSYIQAIKQKPGNIENYYKAIKIEPDNADLYFMLGNALVKQNEIDEGIVFYKMALQLSPNHSECRLHLENLLEKKSQTNQYLLSTEVRLIAFYLPQFHPIPENDLWWGKGFTEWTNVSKAIPLFEGHYQPHLPGDLGFYDLRLPEVREEQASLARKYGIFGFCYYYYWFAGKRLLHRPLDEVLQTKKPNFPFCVCWANENWTRRWDGAEHEILVAQDYCFEQNQAFAESLIPILLDERYIRINGVPLLIIYRAGILPDPIRTTEQWRKVFRKNGVGEVHLCAALTFSLEDPIAMGFDSGVQFPPHGVVATEIDPSTVGAEDFSGKMYDYREVAINALSNQQPNFKQFLSVMSAWDNTARRKKAGNIFLNSAPDVYEFWLRETVERTKQIHLGDERLIFINAWNEWGEGAHLEPDRKYGHGYLAATRRAVSGTHTWKTTLNLLRYLPFYKVESRNQLLDELERRIESQDKSIEVMSEFLKKRDPSTIFDPQPVVSSQSNSKFKPVFREYQDFFNNLIWQDNKMILDELVFIFDKGSSSELQEEALSFHKTQLLVEEYERLLSAMKDFHPSNILEVGMKTTGSVVFWWKLFQPGKYVVIDTNKLANSEYFQERFALRRTKEQLRIFGNTNSQDSKWLTGIVNREFGQQLLDLVIDDSSHNYELAKFNFETIFPCLRPGGIYIIENLAWQQRNNLGNLSSQKLSPPNLIFELVELKGSSTNIIETIITYKGFTIVRRGGIHQAELGDFKLANHIYRHPRN